MLRIRFRHKPRRMPQSDASLPPGPEARISKLRKIVTALIRHERIEGKAYQLDEARGYAERLIQLASSKGPNDPEMIETADYWLLEKDLIPKLFNVLVPRYQHSRSSYTAFYYLPSIVPAHEFTRHIGLLELKNNPWPPVKQYEDLSRSLLNILLTEARKEYREEKYEKFAEARAAAASNAVPAEPDLLMDSAETLTDLPDGAESAESGEEFYASRGKGEGTDVDALPQSFSDTNLQEGHSKNDKKV